MGRAIVREGNCDLFFRKIRTMIGLLCDYIYTRIQNELCWFLYYNVHNSTTGESQ